MQDAGCRMRDMGCKMQDAGCGMFGGGAEMLVGILVPGSGVGGVGDVGKDYLGRLQFAAVKKPEIVEIDRRTGIEPAGRGGAIVRNR